MDWRTDYKSALAWFTESFMCYNENVTDYKSAPARITIGAGNISAGTYIVTLYFTNGDIQNRKIVKVN